MRKRRMSANNAALMLERKKRIDEIVDLLSDVGMTAKDVQARFECGLTSAHSILRECETSGRAKSAKIQLSVGGKVNFYFSKSTRPQTIQAFVKKHTFLANPKWKKNVQPEPQLEYINDYVDLLRGLTSFKPPSAPKERQFAEKNISAPLRKVTHGIGSAQVAMEMMA